MVMYQNAAVTRKANGGIYYGSSPARIGRNKDQNTQAKANSCCCGCSAEKKPEEKNKNDNKSSKGNTCCK